MMHQPSYHYYFGKFETETASKGRLLQQGWNSLTFTEGKSVSIEKLLAGLTGSVKVAQDEDGATYWPEYGVDDIGMLHHGDSYRLFVESETVFRAPELSGTSAVSSESVLTTRHYSVPPSNLDGSAVLLVHSDLEDGDEIAVRTGDGEIIGAGVVRRGKAGITLWSEEKPGTPGTAVGESLLLTGWAASRQLEIPLEISGAEGAQQGNLVFTPNAVEKVDVSETIVPSSFELFTNYPNPFNAQTMVRYDVPTESKVSLQVFNVMGQRVATLVNAVKSAGSYEVSFDATGLSSGSYFLRLVTSNKVITKRMMIVK